MYSYCWVWWNVQAEVDVDEFSPPEILPFHAALVLSALTWLLALLLSSVSVLMLIMPPIKIYIKSYNATRSHAGDQRPGKAETAVKSERTHRCGRYWLLGGITISEPPWVLVLWASTQDYNLFLVLLGELESILLGRPGLPDQVLLSFGSVRSSDKRSRVSVLGMCIASAHVPLLYRGRDIMRHKNTGNQGRDRNRNRNLIRVFLHSSLETPDTTVTADAPCLPFLLMPSE